jgi:DNA-binding beta-propeller fold protein YncE
MRGAFPAWIMLILFGVAGCGDGTYKPQVVWGKRGVRNGDLVRPRAIAIDAQDRIYVVDFTARIQVYDRDGTYLGPTWTTPDYRNGRPSGLGIDRDNHLIVCDSHYSCVRIYAADGTELRKFGEAGTSPGKLGYVSDAVQDVDGYFYLAEFGENQRISKFDEHGNFVSCWGSPGSEPGQFARARALALGPDGLLYVADSCNHRVQVFTRDGELVRVWGDLGDEPGRLKYPYDLAFDKKTGVLYVAEYGNHRVQKFTPSGASLGCWGEPGHKPGQFHFPWALAVDSRGCVHVVDTENHRVQRIEF